MPIIESGTSLISEPTGVSRSDGRVKLVGRGIDFQVFQGNQKNIIEATALIPHIPKPINQSLLPPVITRIANTEDGFRYIYGMTKPNAKISISNRGQLLASTTSDINGRFAFERIIAKQFYKINVNSSSSYLTIADDGNP